MFRQTALLGLACLPLVFGQASTDFESGWNQTAWPIYANDCSSGGSVTLDSTTAHSGKNSIKVAGAGGYCGHIFFGTTAIPSGDLYVRVWMKPSVALTQSHDTFITMLDSSLGTDKHLRIGGQSGIVIYNRETDDATLPDLSPQGIAASSPLAANTWQCLEYHLSTNGTIQTWLNSVAIAGLTYIPGGSNPNATEWARTTYVPKITGVYFGWESYGDDVNTIWYDDVAVESTRVGCATTSSSATPSASAA